MADILRVTSPVINKNIIQPDKALKDPSVPFDMQEIRHITKNPSGSGLLGHHNVLEGEAGAATLMNLLKDPAVTVNYLKNIYMLEEIINLHPEFGMEAFYEITVTDLPAIVAVADGESIFSD